MTDRVILADALPLDSPLVVQIFPCYVCNFKCHYCHMSIPPKDREFVSHQAFMDTDQYRLWMGEMRRFATKPRVLRFVGMGEPLMHPDIVEMVEIATMYGVAEKVEILTNGSLLTNRMSTALVSAGLDRLVISLQGLSAKKYKEVCGATIDWEKFVGQIEYFYKHRGNCYLRIKIIDIALDDGGVFGRVFGPICDSTVIENSGPIYPGVEYNHRFDARPPAKTQYGIDRTTAKVCPQAFVSMQINPDGNVVPCYSIAYPDIMGNCNEDNPVHIWRSPRFDAFRRKMLDGLAGNDVCRDCKIIHHRIYPQDVIDGEVERLKKEYA